MLDIAFIREHRELVKEAISKKHVSLDLDVLLKLDDDRLKLLKSIENSRAHHNNVNETVALNKEKGEDISHLISNMKELKYNLQKEENKLKAVLDKWRELMLLVPNIPDTSVPDGRGEKDNKELKNRGDKPSFAFTTKNHMQIMEELDMVDFKRGSKVHGFRGYFLKNDGALLAWAVWNYAQEFFLKKNFIPFIAPAIVKKEYFYGTGHLPTDAEDLYVTQDSDYLSGTAEVPMMAYHSNEVLSKDELPKRYLAFSPCYRREAGSYGKDTKGLVRVHEFFKFEQLVLCEASHEESVKLHEEINRNHEEFIESLGIPYRQVSICTGDLKSAQVKSYDTELWVPSENKYREIASASYYHDFQTRRFNIRYKDDETTVYTHSLNGTAAPTPRLLVALIENFQQENGSVLVPEVLQKYVGKEVLQ